MVASISERILGRAAAEDIKHPIEDRVICSSGTIIDERIADLIEEDQDEHYDMAKKLLAHAEDQNKRLDNDYKNACRILELGIDLANKQGASGYTPDDPTVEPLPAEVQEKK